MGRFKLGVGAPAAANLLRRALGVLWIADALVKLALPFGDQPGEQSYEQVMTAESAPPGFHRIFAWETNVFLGHPFLWWLPAAVELGAGGWLVLRPASHRALAASASWALAVWAVGEGFGGPASGGSPLTATRAPPCYTRRPRSSCSRAARSGTGLSRRRRRACSASGAGCRGWCCGSARRS